MDRFPGGKGANQAVAAARAGAATSMVARTGDDADGAMVTAHLEAAGVDVRLVETLPSTPTGTALITVAGGENSIVVMAGANALLDASALSSIELVAGDVVVAQLETPVPTTMAAFAAARSAGVTTILNPAPAAALSASLLALTDHLVLNAHELEHLFGVAPTEATADAPLEAARRVGYQGVLVVTLGAQGVVVLGLHHGIVRLAGHQVRAVDTTGAGDCFVGYYAAALAAGVPVPDAAATANAAAAISVTRAGATTAIPRRDEVDAVGPVSPAS